MGKSDNRLSALIWDLSKLLVDQVDQSRKNGKIPLVNRVYIKPKIESLTYKEGQNSIAASTQFLQKECWLLKDRQDLIDKLLKPTQQFTLCVGAICSRYNVPEQQAAQSLQTYLLSLIDGYNGGMTDSDIVNRVTTFLNDLEHNPCDWNITVWLDGVWLEGESYQLTDGMTLRRVNASDLEIEVPLEIAHILPPPQIFDIGSAVLNFSVRTADWKEPFNAIEAILNCLRLFRLGSVIGVKFRVSPNSYLRSEPQLSKSPSFFAMYKYELKTIDVATLKTFLEEIRPILPKDSAGNPTILGNDPISIALRRYKEALFHSGRIENRITSAITALEAIYLKISERMELSHRLAQRVSLLLRFFDFHPLEVYRNVDRAYEIRSTFIHGGAIDPKDNPSVTELCRTIIEYLRLSLLVFLQLNGALEKEQIINKLDNALLDEGALKKTGQLFQKDILITR